MEFTFRFPDIGEGLEEGTIAQWYVKEGDIVETGDSIVKMETDKVVTDIPSPRNGTVAKCFGEVGEVIEVGSPLVIINIADTDQDGKQEQVEVEEKGAGVVGTIEVASKNDVIPSSTEIASNNTKPTNVNRKALATPVARALAKKFGIDINQIEGSGKAGRVMKEDILEHSNSRSSTSETAKPIEELELTQIRKTIAKNMIESKHNAAHMALFDEAVVDDLIEIRQKIKAHYQEQNIKISYLHFLLKAIALSLEKHPYLNSELDLNRNKILLKRYVNIGIAVDTPKGLVVPVLKDANKLSIQEIAIQTNKLAEKARDGKLTLKDMSEGTFTITNFGTIGGRYAMPIINYPQTGIMGAGKIFGTPIIKNDQVIKGTVMPLSISVDHRIVDGAEVTRFMNQVIFYLEHPEILLMS